MPVKRRPHINAPSLWIKSGLSEGKVVPLPTVPGRCVLGRDYDCQLQFDPDQERQVSRHHAMLIHKNQGTVLLLDLDSTFGTFFRQQPVSSVDGVTLEDGDVFRLGEDGPEIELLYQFEALLGTVVISKAALTSQQRANIPGHSAGTDLVAMVEEGPSRPNPNRANDRDSSRMATPRKITEQAPSVSLGQEEGSGGFGAPEPDGRRDLDLAFFGISTEKEQPSRGDPPGPYQRGSAASRPFQPQRSIPGFDVSVYAQAQPSPANLAGPGPIPRRHPSQAHDRHEANLPMEVGQAPSRSSSAPLSSAPLSSAPLSSAPLSSARRTPSDADGTRILALHSAEVKASKPAAPERLFDSRAVLSSAMGQGTAPAVHSRPLRSISLFAHPEAACQPLDLVENMADPAATGPQPAVSPSSPLEAPSVPELPLFIPKDEQSSEKETPLVSSWEEDTGADLGPVTEIDGGAEYPENPAHGFNPYREPLPATHSEIHSFRRVVRNHLNPSLVLQCVVCWVILGLACGLGAGLAITANEDDAEGQDMAAAQSLDSR